jgi:hypothetical protein
MKQLRIFSIISCFIMIFYVLIFSFSDISIADERLDQRTADCLNSCNDKDRVCYNMTADQRRCDAIYQECVAACKVKDDSSSSSPKE